MGITDFFSDVWETFSHPSPDAEVQGGSSTKTPSSGTDEESDAESEVNKQDAKSGDSDEQGHKPSEDDEEEEEEEIQDPKDILEQGESNPRLATSGDELRSGIRSREQIGAIG